MSEEATQVGLCADNDEIIDRVTPFARPTDSQVLEDVSRRNTVSPLVTHDRREQPRASSGGDVGVSLVIPAKNEGKNLPFVLEHVPDCVDEIILVDSSTDVTRLIARSCRPDVRIISSPQKGKGNALRMGFQAARGDLIIAMDADGSMSPDEIPQYVYFLSHGYDFVKGSRFVGGGGSLDITPIRRAGNRLLLAAANVMFETNLTDLCYGFFGFRRCYLDHLHLHATGFEIEAEVTVRAVLAGLRVAEVPSLELPRRQGHSNLHAIQDGQRILQTLVHQKIASKRDLAAPVVAPVALESVRDDAIAESG